MLPLAKPEETPVGHQPVLLRQVLDLLAPRPGATVVDATLGAGGHAQALLAAIGDEGRLIGIDRDASALELAGERLAGHGVAFTAVHGRHEELQTLLRQSGVFVADAILFDLGVSSMQLDDPARGFSFRHDGPLDMRMDGSDGPTAADLLAEIDERELTDLLRSYGEERMASPIARAIVRRRRQQPLRTTRDLAQLVEDVLGPRARAYRIHPATRTFQALRIAVNGEVRGLERLVADAVAMLRRGGRLAVIAYHSLEDRAVKTAMRALASRCTCPPRLPVCRCGREDLVRLVTTRAVRPDETEIAANPRARSARLRVAERL